MSKAGAASRLNKSRGFTSLIKKQQNSQRRPNPNSPFNLTCLGENLSCSEVPILSHPDPPVRSMTFVTTHKP